MKNNLYTLCLPSPLDVSSFFNCYTTFGQQTCISGAITRTNVDHVGWLARYGIDDGRENALPGDAPNACSCVPANQGSQISTPQSS